MSAHKIFPWPKETMLMMVAFQRTVEEEVNELRKRLISADNVQRFSHGVGWQSHNSSDPDEVSELKSHSYEMVIPFDAIKLGRLEIIQQQADALIKSMHDSFERLMIEMVSDGADRVGNSIQSKGSTAAALIAMFEKIEFGVDRQGKASLPTIVISPQDAYKFAPERLAAEMPDYQARLDKIAMQKAESAELAEQQRRARFKRGVK
ncbi:hypothetical protein [Cupriavidus alkaliphilus]|uniref:hypothetical protein n=1 Tax=Cupriavidus alkaliphilus TaxID=942866 RepID=UPI00339D45A6